MKRVQDLQNGNIIIEADPPTPDAAAELKNVVEESIDQEVLSAGIDNGFTDVPDVSAIIANISGN